MSCSVTDRDLRTKKVSASCFPNFTKSFFCAYLGKLKLELQVRCFWLTWADHVKVFLNTLGKYILKWHSPRPGTQYLFSPCQTLLVCHNAAFLRMFSDLLGNHHSLFFRNIQVTF